jgi:hypothetical protein
MHTTDVAMTSKKGLPKAVLAEGIFHKSCVVSRLNIGNFE